MPSAASSDCKICTPRGARASSTAAWRRRPVPGKKLKVTLTRSLIGLSPTQEATVKALGLRRMHQVVEHDDTPTIRGMIAAVPHVLEVSREAQCPPAGAGGREGPQARGARAGIRPR